MDQRMDPALFSDCAAYVRLNIQIQEQGEGKLKDNSVVSCLADSDKEKTKLRQVRVMRKIRASDSCSWPTDSVASALTVAGLVTDCASSLPLPESRPVAALLRPAGPTAAPTKTTKTHAANPGAAAVNAQSGSFARLDMRFSSHFLLSHFQLV